MVGVVQPPRVWWGVSVQLPLQGQGEMYPQEREIHVTTTITCQSSRSSTNLHLYVAVPPTCVTRTETALTAGSAETISAGEGGRMREGRFSNSSSQVLQEV